MRQPWWELPWHLAHVDQTVVEAESGGLLDVLDHEAVDGRIAVRVVGREVAVAPGIVVAGHSTGPFRVVHIPEDIRTAVHSIEDNQVQRLKSEQLRGILPHCIPGTKAYFVSDATHANLRLETRNK